MSAWWFVLGAALVVAAPEPARAANNEMGDVLVDGFYGGLIGALVGAGVMVLTDDPGDHLQYMTTGAGIGVIAGTIYGLSQVARYAMINVDRGQLTWRVPAIEPAVTSPPGETPNLSVSAALVRVRF
ncbi:MAG: hypothetical protein AB1451_07975 [Nitrospirota bacterium]